MKQIDKYLYDEENPLGKGQFGAVFKGINVETNEPVAIKVIATKIYSSSYLTKLMNNEIHALKKIQSERIVRFIDLKTTANNIYIITEFCDGGDLAEYLLKQKRLDEEEVYAILIQIIEALKDMQRLNFIHRDLKPANFLIHQGRIKLADLGFVRSVENFKSSLLHSTVGSPIYMSPQLLLKQGYTSKCDIWSLGIILYQLLYGDCPWRALDMPKLVKKIQTEPVVFKEGVQISPDLQDLIFRCLQYEEKDRMSYDELFSHRLILQLKHRLDVTDAKNRQRGNGVQTRSRSTTPSKPKQESQVPAPHRYITMQSNRVDSLPSGRKHTPSPYRGTPSKTNSSDQKVIYDVNLENRSQSTYRPMTNGYPVTAMPITLVQNPAPPYSTGSPGVRLPPANFVINQPNLPRYNHHYGGPNFYHQI